jgi:GNAT superfamily N-acetyltransferase
MEHQATVNKNVERVTLRDGTRLTIRPIQLDDKLRLQELFFRLSSESIYFRFLGQRKELPDKEAEQFANVDCRTRMALVTVNEQYGRSNIVAVAQYDALTPDEPDIAEVAIVVEDGYQGRGLGTFLAKRLVAYAIKHGIRFFQFAVHQGNTRVLHLVRHSGLPLNIKTCCGIWEMRVDLIDATSHEEAEGAVGEVSYISVLPRPKETMAEQPSVR